MIMFKKIDAMTKWALIRAIKAYQRYKHIMLPASCRFYPSCSQYALDAVNRYGTIKGIFLASLRILRCHPFHPGGFDPVK